MFGDTIVPIDGSRNSRRSIRIAAAISETLNGRMDVVCFTRGPITRDFRRQVSQLAREAGPAVPMHIEVAPQQGPAEELIVEHIAGHPAHLVCMAAHGRSRSPALLGTVTEAVVHRSHRPVLLIGPSVRTVGYDPGSTVVLTSDHADPVDVAQGWSRVFGGAIEATSPEHAVSAAALSRAAVIVAEVEHLGPLDRLLHGSVLADLIHDAPCPVVAVSTKQDS